MPDVIQISSPDDAFTQPSNTQNMLCMVMEEDYLLWDVCEAFIGMDSTPAVGMEYSSSVHPAEEFKTCQ